MAPKEVLNEDNYEILNAPKYAITLMASRKNPRVHPGVPADFGDHVSRMLQRNELSVDPTTGEIITDAGQTIPQLGDFYLSTRPHAFITDPPKEEKEKLAEIWTSPNMTARSARYKELLDYHKNPKLANIAFSEEAAEFGVSQPFSDQAGVNPADAGDKAKAAERQQTNNPWAKTFRGTPEDRWARIASICKTSTKMANDLSRAAGTTLAKPLI